MDPQELALTHPQVSCEDHMTELHEQYKGVEEEYLKIIEKLAASAETWQKNTLLSKFLLQLHDSVLKIINSCVFLYLL